jgi:hypothetical protein
MWEITAWMGGYQDGSSNKQQGGQGVNESEKTHDRVQRRTSVKAEINFWVPRQDRQLQTFA